MRKKELKKTIKHLKGYNNELYQDVIKRAIENRKLMEEKTELKRKNAKLTLENIEVKATRIGIPLNKLSE